jgi:hypothetical protein
MNETAAIDDFLAGSLRQLRRGERAEWALPEEFDWEQVWQRIEYHGIPFLLHAEAGRLGRWPPALLERMAEEARLIVLWETTHHDVVARLLRELDRAGIEAIVMKGTALAYSFHDEPATRRRGDTDLLVRPSDQKRTRALLKELGWYRREDPHGLYYQEGWMHDAAGFFVHSIDLHWEPSDRPILQGILPLETFFEHKHAMPRLGPGAFRPDPALMMIHATINQKWHSVHGYDAEGGRLTSPRRLIWSVDFDLLVGSMVEADWRRLRKHCEAAGVGPMMAEALRGMQQDLLNELPEDAVAWLEAQALDPALMAYFASEDSLAQFWIDLRKARTFSEKRRLVTLRAFPPRDHLIDKYPAAKGWPTLLLQMRMLAETAGRAMRQAISQ